MAYSELIKNFERTRAYIREFYVYGYKSRIAYQQKSSRSYDEERRHIESWLASYVQFHQTADGKHMYLSINSRVRQTNPLFRIWKTRSFTAGDITLHFILFDILASGESYTLQQLIECIDENYLSQFDKPKTFDSSTIRKKLKEYENQGVIISRKCGKTLEYRKVCDPIPLEPLQTAIQYYSEIAPCGVIGSYLTDKLSVEERQPIAFKHHYITQVIDSEILYRILDAMRQQREIHIVLHIKNQNDITMKTVTPLQILISAQNGRQYLLAYDDRNKRIYTHRIDYITKVNVGDVMQDYKEKRNKLADLEKHMWGVSIGPNRAATEHVEFTVEYSPDEFYIYQRMVREKRCGIVERIDDMHCKFTADVYDTIELFPWIRTFLCRITDLQFSNKEAEALFRNDVVKLYQIYGLETNV